jgi:hypothetical protein
MTNKYDIATAMNSIMASPRHQAVFAKPQPQFTKTAADKNENGDKVKDAVAACKKVMKDMKCGGSVKASGDTVVITCSDKDAVKKCKALCKKHGVKCEVKEPKQSKASRYHACVMGLAKISEYLDDAGLSKEAAYTLLALDGLVRNAMPSGDDGDCGMAKDKKTTHKHELAKHTHEDDDDPECHVHKGKGKTKNLSEKEEKEIGKKKFPFNKDDEDDEDDDDCGSMVPKQAQTMYMPTDYMTPQGWTTGPATGPGAARMAPTPAPATPAIAPKLHPLDPGLDIPDSFLNSTDPNDPLNPWMGTPPDPATINAIFKARKAYRAAGGDDSFADTHDIFQAPASKGDKPNWEEHIDTMGMKPHNLPLQLKDELGLYDFDLEEDGEGDLRSRMDDEEDEEDDSSSFLMGLIDEELEGFEAPEFGTKAIARKNLTSLQKVALELRKARRGVRRPF